MTAPTLNALGLGLRATRPEEIAFVREAEAAPENAEFVGQWTEDEHSECMQDTDCLHLVIEDPATEELLGYVVLQGLRDANRAMLLRRLVMARKGRGAGPRAVEAVIRYCFETCRFHRLWLDVREDNAPARRIYERFGFVLEGRERENIRVGSRWLSTIRMSMLDREYAEKTRRGAR